MAGQAKRLALAASYAPSLINFRLPLIEAALAAGHDVLCLAPDFTDAIRAALAARGCVCRGYPIARTGLNPLADAATVRALTAAFRDWRPDVVMGYTPKAAIYSAIAAQRAGVERIVPMVTGLGYAFLEEGGLKQRLIRLISEQLYRVAFRCSSAVIFHNRDDLAVLAGRGLLPAMLPTHVVSGSGVDLEHFGPMPLPDLAEGVRFLMIARLVRYKGIEEYCKAARIVKRDGVRARFLLVGPEESGPAGFSRDAIAAYADAVDYLGPQDDVRAQLAQCHIYVLPSYGEGMPRTVLEALATGRPVITTDTRGCRETVEPDINGVLVPVGDAVALARAMQGLLRRPDRIPAMASASRRLAEARFSAKKVAAETLAALGLETTAR